MRYFILLSLLLLGSRCQNHSEFALDIDLSDSLVIRNVNKNPYQIFIDPRNHSGIMHHLTVYDREGKIIYGITDFAKENHTYDTIQIPEPLIQDPQYRGIKKATRLFPDVYALFPWSPDSNIYLYRQTNQDYGIWAQAQPSQDYYFTSGSDLQPTLTFSDSLVLQNIIPYGIPRSTVEDRKALYQHFTDILFHVDEQYRVVHTDTFNFWSSVDPEIQAHIYLMRCKISDSVVAISNDLEADVLLYNVFTGQKKTVSMPSAHESAYGKQPVGRINRAQFMQWYHDAFIYQRASYDAHNKLYYRIVKYPDEAVNDQGQAAGFRGKDWGLLVFNEDFEKLTERRFKGEAFYPFISFAPEKLYIASRTKSRAKEEDYLVFQGFDIPMP